jgi:hypothetical protein
MRYSGSGIIRRRRLSRAISCGDRTPSMIVGTACAGFGLRRFPRQLLGSLPGMPMLLLIIAAEM